MRGLGCVIVAVILAGSAMIAVDFLLLNPETRAPTWLGEPGGVVVQAGLVLGLLFLAVCVVRLLRGTRRMDDRLARRMKEMLGETEKEAGRDAGSRDP